MYVKPKKFLGQHFLTDETVAEKIANALTFRNYDSVVEIGPGMGVLTKYLLEKNCNLKLIEIDHESVTYLKSNYNDINDKIIEADFLETSISQIFNNPFAVIGNFPYNISTEILFKVLDNKNLVLEVVGMFQKEVAERIASKPGNRDYGIPSVLLQASYDIEYLFTVNENVFNPPPRVKSGVIRMQRNFSNKLISNESKFKLVVKTGFNQRRKTLRNSLKSLIQPGASTLPFLDKRPEQLSWQQFDEITVAIFGSHS